VLAGGRGSRLGGTDKARLEIAGLTTLRRVHAALEGLTGETILVVNDDRLADEPGVRLLRDPEPHAGVLPALQAALEAASQALALLVACDMPFLSPALLRRQIALGRRHDVVLPIVGGQAQPMHAVYRREPSLASVRAALARGDRRMISFLDGLDVRRLEEDELRAFDPALRSFFNINTPEDLVEARRIAELDRS
jgi:molybdenum cofactor guanylyltransferase